MLPLEAYKDQLASDWPQDDVLRLSCVIIDYLSAAPNDELHYITLYTLRTVTGKDQTDEPLLRAVAILTNSSQPALEMRLMYEDDESSFELDKADLQIARNEGALHHPVKDEEIPNFEDYIFPFFIPTPLLLEMKDGARAED